MIEIKKTHDGLFYVELLFRPAFEEMFDRATHVARFEREADARSFSEKVRDKIRKAPVYNVLLALDLRYWQGPTSRASGYQWNAEVAPFVVAAKA